MLSNQATDEVLSLFYVIFLAHNCLQIIAEAANGPTTLAADELLRQRNILIIPVCFDNFFAVIWLLILSHCFSDMIFEPLLLQGGYIISEFVYHSHRVHQCELAF